MKNVFRFLFSIIALSCVSFGVMNAQTVTPMYVRSYPVGQIADAGAAVGIALPDGNRIFAEEIAIGIGLHDNPSDGVWNASPTSLGGIYNGINNPADNTNPLGPGLALSGYVGSKVPQTFTNVSSFAFNVDEGRGNPVGSNRYANAIGYHIWFAKKIVAAQFLFVDLDGNGNGRNGEWHTAYGYNDDARVFPAITIGSATSLGIQTNPGSLSTTWSTAKPSATADGFGGAVANPSIVLRILAGGTNADPDNTDCQVIYQFNEIDGFNHFYTLWGALGNFDPVADAAQVQNSGVSPFVMPVYPDYGDAPASFNGGTPAVHGIYTTIKIGEDTDSENAEASAGADADDNSASDDEDGIVVAGSPNSPPPAMGVRQTGTSEAVNGYQITVRATNDLGMDAKLIGWIDWNNNGTFESSEASPIVTVASASGTNNYVLNWGSRTMEYPVTTPYPTQTFLRIRLATSQNISGGAVIFDATTPNGSFDYGEVEDYAITLDTNLPVTLSDFKAKSVENNNVLLLWATTMEKGNSGFEIQRSIDAINYNQVGSVEGHGTTTDTQNYTFLDQLHSLSNFKTFYYRLKQLDFDGSFEISRAISVDLSDQLEEFLAKPTLLRSETPLLIEGEDIRDVKIFTASGSLIAEKKYAGQSQISLDLSGIRSGLYIININSRQSIKIAVL